MVTLLPTGPEAGEKEVMTGGIFTVKDVLVVVPPALVTVIVPVVAPAGTVAAICDVLFTVKLASTPLNFTDVISLNLVPLIIIGSPTQPFDGATPVITGFMGRCFKAKRKP
jgi:hypothetical protein